MDFDWWLSDITGKRALFSETFQRPWFTRKATGDEPLAVGWDVSIPHYSESIEAVMEVVEKIGFEPFSEGARSINLSVLSIHRYPDGEWLAHFSGKRTGKAYAKTLPEAICLAALKALE